MTETKYLYGASVQGIQDFIFRTNELKDIVGASELVEKICTRMFDKFKSEGKVVVNAAGNVKCIYPNRAACSKAVLEFPKAVMESATGITISQAVVTLSPDESDFEQKVEELERRLRVQRNKPFRSLTLGSMAMLRSRTTGLPAVETIKDKDRTDGVEFLDEATLAKRSHPKNSTLELAKKSFGNVDLSCDAVAFNIEDLTDGNDWIAIIHADGNGLGQIVATKNKRPGELKDFSEKLDEATIRAAQQTYDDIMKSKDYKAVGNAVPLRPVVLGGDDMTIICRASLAMQYAESYIRHFEENTRASGDPLTACAGIAYMKSSYPFHYGYHLAEALCEEAKKDAKLPGHLQDGKAPSCIMFHKIQGSYIGSFKQIERDELTIDEKNSLKFGPYYLNKVDDRWTIQELRHNVARLASKDGNAAKTDIRQWLTIMKDDTAFADQQEKRVKVVSTTFNKETFKKATTPVIRNGVYTYPAFDMLQLLTVENQITKEDNDE